MIGNTDVVNRILLALPAAEFEALRPALSLVDLHHADTVCEPDEPMHHIYFINRGIVSLIKRMKNGEAVEIGARGIEGLTAPETLLGVDMPLFEAVVQIPGSAFRISKAVLQAELHRRPQLEKLIHAYVHASASQIAQTAACNRLHFLEQRCCRWLLIAMDNARSDTFPLTQEFLAMMLGVHRPGISVALKRFQGAGMITYTRGRMTITDRAGIEAEACECYRTICDEFDRLFASHAAA
jgi:CRP-like cAMP-binding protein